VIAVVDDDSTLAVRELGTRSHADTRLRRPRARSPRQGPIERDDVRKRAAASEASRLLLARSRAAVRAAAQYGHAYSPV